MSSAEEAVEDKSAQGTRPSVIQYATGLAQDDEIVTAQHEQLETDVLVHDDFPPQTQGTQTQVD